MIHTFTIATALESDVISAVLSAMNQPAHLINTDFSPEFNPNDTTTHMRMINTREINYPGVKMIKLTRSTLPGNFNSAEEYEQLTGYPPPDNVEFTGYNTVSLPAGNYFTLSMELNPYRLIHPVAHTINLFTPTANNVMNLINEFPDMINTLFSDLDDNTLTRIENINGWNIRRVDYTFDFHFDDDQQRNVFDRLVHKTSRLIRTKSLKVSGRRRYDQSAAEANKSYKIICYSKMAEIDSQTYIGYHDKNRLLHDSYGIQRFEIQNKYNGISALMTRHISILNRAVPFFLDVDIAYQELLKRYTQIIGTEDFFNRQSAARILRSNYSDTTSSKLIDILQMVAQTRSLAVARKKFTEGGYRIKISNKVLSGSKSTFDKRVKMIREAGINPVLITDKDKLEYLANPIHQLIEYYQSITANQVDNNNY